MDLRVNRNPFHCEMTITVTVPDADLVRMPRQGLLIFRQAGASTSAPISVLLSALADVAEALEELEAGVADPG